LSDSKNLYRDSDGGKLCALSFRLCSKALIVSKTRFEIKLGALGYKLNGV